MNEVINEFMPFALQSNRVYIKGLEKIGYIKKEEAKKLLAKLKQIEKSIKTRKIKFEKTETCQTIIQKALIKRYKKLGIKIQLSSDQSDLETTTNRLFLKEKIIEIIKESKKIARKFIDLAQKFKKTPVSLSSLSHYFCSYAESLLDDIDFLTAIQKNTIKSPLGSIDGFGTTLLLDREWMQKELKLKKTQINSLYCVSSNGKIESMYLEGTFQISLTLDKFASDLISFIPNSSNLFKIKKSLNLKELKIIRINTNKIINIHSLIQNSIKGLKSGFHEEFTTLQPLLAKVTNLLKENLQITQKYLQGIKQPNKSVEEKNQKNIESKISLGGAGNLDIHYYKTRLKKI